MIFSSPARDKSDSLHFLSQLRARRPLSTHPLVLSEFGGALKIESAPQSRRFIWWLEMGGT